MQRKEYKVRACKGGFQVSEHWGGMMIVGATTWATEAEAQAEADRCDRYNLARCAGSTGEGAGK